MIDKEKRRKNTKYSGLLNIRVRLGGEYPGIPEAISIGN